MAVAAGWLLLLAPLPSFGPASAAPAAASPSAAAAAASPPAAAAAAPAGASPPATTAATAARAEKGIGPIRFEEIGAKAGARLLHHTRRFSGKHADVLAMFTSGGAAVAVGDYDNDGFDDLFVTDSESGRGNHLLHNNGDMTFTEVTEKAGVAKGNDPGTIVSDALWFDYDNDGREDLLVARFGTPLLYHNEGNGKFRDVTAASGLNKFANTIAVIAFDYDNDGYLDLLFGNYFKPVNLFDLKDPHVLPNNLDQADNGGGVTLWRNMGNGTFVDVTEKAGLGRHTGWTLDVGHGDFNNDGWQDIYLADDYGTDRLFLNNGNGTFREVTEEAIGFDTKKGMNVDVADYDRDGWLDIYVTNITDEYMKECNMLWHNNGVDAAGRLTFTDLSRETGTCSTLWGWAAKWADFDNDGWVDLVAADGLRSAGPKNYIPVLLEMIITPGIDFTDVNSWPDIGDMSWSGFQRKKLFRNLGSQAFKEMAHEAGVDNDLDGRGIGVADFDNDGRLDYVQTNANQPSLLYRNVTSPVGNWIELKLVGTRSNRDAIGARVTAKAGGALLIREVDGGNGYSSQSSKRVHIGLGTAAKIDSLEIRWPSGLREQVTVPINRISYVKEGSGVVEKAEALRPLPPAGPGTEKERGAPSP
ncbi:MAG TPA: CRTAC1 family protein [Thermoanaerobaculia bacterium]|nr:CRTAC1 family protein [Thermoanaerobaculia bacterium]